MNIAYYIKDNNSNFKRLDFFEDESIEYTNKLIDAENIVALFNDLSNTFSVPATSRNNKIFKNWFEIGIQNGFDPNKRVDSYIEFNTIPLRYGVTQLEEIREEDGNLSHYRISFYGKLTGLDDRFGDTTLKDLEYLDNFDFNYTENNIKALFENPSLVITEGGIDFTPSLVMPLILPVDREIKYFSSTTADNSVNITTEEGGLSLKDFRPALRQYRIIEAIEDKFDIKFSRDFINSNDFLNLYTSLNHNEDYTNIKKWLPLGLGSVTPNDFISINNDVLNFNITSQELKNRIGSESEDVDVLLQIEINVPNPQGDGFLFFRLVDENDTIIEETEEGIFIGTEVFNTHYYINTERDDLFNKDYRLQVYSNGEYTEADGTIYEITYKVSYKSNTYTFSNLELDSTGIIPLGNISPVFGIRDNIKDITVSNYIKNLIKEFKLIVRPISTTEYTLIKINDYFKNGNQLNITSKTNIENVETEIFNNNKKINYSLNKEEDTFTQKQFKTRNGRFRGDSIKTFPVDNKKETEVSIDFEVPYFVRLKDSGSDILTGINLAQYSEFNNVEFSSIFPSNFLQFYYVGLSVIDKPIKLNIFPDSESQSFFIEINSVPICDSSNSFTFTQITNNLDFANTTINGWHRRNIENNLYNKNHKPFLNNLINSDSRITTLDAKLSTQDILNLDLNTNVIYKNNIYLIDEFTTDLRDNSTTFRLFPSFENQYEITGIEIENMTFDFTYGGGFASIQVQTNADVVNVNTSAEWVDIINVQENARVYNISFFVQERYLTSGRVTNIQLEVDSQTHIIQVNQNARPSSISNNDTLTVSQSNWVVDESVVQIPIDVTSNTYWKVLESSPEIEVSTELGYSNDDFKIDITENPTVDERTLNLQVKNLAETITRNIEIVQDGIPNISLVDNSIVINGDAQTFTVDVISNGSFNYYTNSSGLSPQYGSGNGNTSITFGITENPSTTVDRSAVISFYRVGGNAVTFNLTQSTSAPFINTTPPETVGFRDGTESFNIVSNLSYNISSPNTWITVLTTYGNGNTSVNYTYDINMGAERTGTIIVSDNTTKVTATYTVTQELFVLPQPSTPTKVTTNYSFINNDNDIITVIWKASTSEFDSIKDYIIQRSKSFNSFVQVGIVTGTQFIDTTVDDDSYYRYRVIARDTTNQQSNASNPSTSEYVPFRLDAKPSTFNAGRTGGTATISVESNTNWTLSINSPSNQTATANKTSGNGDDTVIITCPPNQRDYIEEYTITFTYGNNQTDMVRIYQDAYIRTLSVNKTPTSNNVSYEGSTYTLDINSNAYWFIDTSDAWVTTNVSSGTGNATVTITIDESTDTSGRNASFAVRMPLFGGGTESINYTVNQEEAPFLYITPTSITKSDSSHVYDIIVNSNKVWNVSESPDETWVSVSKINNTTARVIVDANDGTKPTPPERDASIIFTTSETPTVTHTLTQEAPTVLYSHITYYSSIGSGDACLSEGNTTPVYTDTSVFENANFVYSESTGSTFAPAGYYNKVGTWIQVGSNGTIIGIGTC